MKGSNKLLSIFLSATMLISLVPRPAHAAQTESEKNQNSIIRESVTVSAAANLDIAASNVNGQTKLAIKNASPDRTYLVYAVPGEDAAFDTWTQLLPNNKVYETSSQEEQYIHVYMKGDVTGDGKLSAADAAAILKIVVSDETLDGLTAAICDMNGSGITAADAAVILKMVVSGTSDVSAEQSYEGFGYVVDRIGPVADESGAMVTYSLWTGSEAELCTVALADNGGAVEGDCVWVSDSCITVLSTEGAVKSYENQKLVFYGNDTSYSIGATTKIIWIDSFTCSGAGAKEIRVAERESTGYYRNNVVYAVGNAGNITALFVDVNNKLHNGEATLAEVYEYTGILVKAAYNTDKEEYTYILSDGRAFTTEVNYVDLLGQDVTFFVDVKERDTVCGVISNSEEIVSDLFANVEFDAFGDESVKIGGKEYDVDDTYDILGVRADNHCAFLEQIEIGMIAPYVSVRAIDLDTDGDIDQFIVTEDIFAEVTYVGKSYINTTVGRFDSEEYSIYQAVEKDDFVLISADMSLITCGIVTEMEKHTGKVASITGEWAEINNKSYNFARLDGHPMHAFLGKEIQFCAYKGYLLYVETVSSFDIYEFAVVTAIAGQAGLTGPQARLLFADCTIAVVNLAEDYTSDISCGDLVRFEIDNGEYELYVIDAADLSDFDAAAMGDALWIAAESSEKANAMVRIGGNNAKFASDAVIFVYDIVEDEYAVMTGADMAKITGDSVVYCAGAHKDSNNALRVEFAYIATEGVSMSSKLYGYITSTIEKSIDVDRNQHETAVIWNGNECVTLTTAANRSFEGAVKGDVICYRLNSSGEADDIVKVGSVGAMTAIDGEFVVIDEMWYEVTGDTSIIYVDHSDCTGEEGGELQVAYELPEGGFLQNVCYVADSDGTLLLLVADVDNDWYVAYDDNFGGNTSPVQPITPDVSDFAVVEEIAAPVGLVGPQARLLFADGTEQIVDLREDYSDCVVSGELVSFNIDSGKYELRVISEADLADFDATVMSGGAWVAADSGDAANAKIDYGGMTGKFASDAVVFVYDPAGEEYSVMTGAEAAGITGMAEVCVAGAIQNANRVLVTTFAYLVTTGLSESETMYGYVVSDITCFKLNSDVFEAVTIWDGNHEIEITTAANKSFGAVNEGDIISYKGNQKGEIVHCEIISGKPLALTVIDGDYVIIEGIQYEIDDETVVIYVDATEDTGAEVGMLSVAEEMEDGSYIPNVQIVTDDKHTLKLLVVDIDNDWNGIMG